MSDAFFSLVTRVKQLFNLDECQIAEYQIESLHAGNVRWPVSTNAHKRTDKLDPTGDPEIGWVGSRRRNGHTYTTWIGSFSIQLNLFGLILVAEKR